MPGTARETAFIHPSDLTLALGLLTRLPIKAEDATRGARAAWAWPLVGAVLGWLAALAGAAALALGLPAPVAAVLALVALVMVGGGLHEDRLADTADGLWGGWTRETRLEIMRDSRTGSYGVIALVLGLGLRALALTAILTDGALAAAAALIVAAMVSRAAVLLAGTSGAAAVAAAALGAAVMARLARARIGGQTGDILGAAQQVAEIAALLCLLP